MKYRISKLMTMVESTAREFIDKAKAEPKRQTRSKEYKSVYKGITVTRNGDVNATFEVSRLDGEGMSYTDHINIPGLATAFSKKAKISTIFDSYRSSDIKVYCSCKDFQYRFVHWLSASGEYNDVGNPDHKIALSDAPDVTNPKNDIGPFCKHLRVSVGVLGANSTEIFKALKSAKIPDAVANMPNNNMNVGNKGLIEAMVEQDTPAQIDSHPNYTEDEKVEAKDAFKAVVESSAIESDIKPNLTPDADATVDSAVELGNVHDVNISPEIKPEISPSISTDSDATPESMKKLDGIVRTDGRLEL